MRIFRLGGKEIAIKRMDSNFLCTKTQMNVYTNQQTCLLKTKKNQGFYSLTGSIRQNTLKVHYDSILEMKFKIK